MGYPCQLDLECLVLPENGVEQGGSVGVTRGLAAVFTSTRPTITTGRPIPG